MRYTEDQKRYGVIIYRGPYVRGLGARLDQDHGVPNIESHLSGHPDEIRVLPEYVRAGRAALRAEGITEGIVH